MKLVDPSTGETTRLTSGDVLVYDLNAGTVWFVRDKGNLENERSLRTGSFGSDNKIYIGGEQSLLKFIDEKISLTATIFEHRSDLPHLQFYQLT